MGVCQPGDPLGFQFVMCLMHVLCVLYGQDGPDFDLGGPIHAHLKLDEMVWFSSPS